jgi:hypothetical protein
MEAWVMSERSAVVGAAFALACQRHYELFGDWPEGEILSSYYEQAKGMGDRFMEVKVAWEALEGPWEVAGDE